MRYYLVICVLCLSATAIAPSTAVQAQSCAAPGPCSCASCQQRQSREALPREAAPRGYYSRSPDTGEYAGENNSMGVRGFGLRLPAISIELPELRLPSLARYRRGPHMTTDSARAPWVEGRALEFNPVGADRDTTDRSMAPSRPRETPSCVAPAPAAETRNHIPANGLDARDAELRLLREQSVSLQKAIDSLANSRAVTEELSEREQLRRKEREVDELRAEIQRMQSIMAKDATTGGQQAKTDAARTEAKSKQTSAKIQPASAEAPQVNRSTNNILTQNGVCNGLQCKAPNSQTGSQQEPVFELPVVNKKYTVARLNNLRSPSMTSR